MKAITGTIFTCLAMYQAYAWPSEYLTKRHCTSLSMDSGSTIKMNGTKFGYSYGMHYSGVQLSTSGTIQLAYGGISIPCNSTIGLGNYTVVTSGISSQNFYASIDNHLGADGSTELFGTMELSDGAKFSGGNCSGKRSIVKTDTVIIAANSSLVNPIWIRVSWGSILGLYVSTKCSYNVVQRSQLDLVESSAGSSQRASFIAISTFLLLASIVNHYFD